jgi:hypothetical protein
MNRPNKQECFFTPGCQGLPGTSMPAYLAIHWLSTKWSFVRMALDINKRIFFFVIEIWAK